MKKGTVLVLAGLVAIAQSSVSLGIAAAQCPFGPSGYETETAGGQAIVRGSGTCSNGRPKTSYYSPSGTSSLNGSQYLLFVQGDDDICLPQPPWDRIFLLQHPNTWAGLTTAFDLSAKTEVLPAGTSQDPNYFYGGPNVFTDAGTYYMTASKSCGAANFNEILMGCSTNGTTWTWRTLFKTLAGVNVSAASLRYSMIGGEHYWWGFIELSPGQHVPAGFPSCSDCLNLGNCRTGYSGLGAIRVHLTSHATSSCSSPTWDRVDIWSSGQWKSVSANGQFNFVPDYVSFQEVNPKLTSVGTGWELWSTSVCENNPGAGCGSCNSGNPTNPGAGFRYRSVTASATGPLAGNPPELFSTIRCLPGNYPSSRWMPFRVEWTNLLYSATKDAVCSSGGDGQYIIVTGLTP